MSPHWPYVTSSDCSYKNFPGEEKKRIKSIVQPRLGGQFEKISRKSIVRQGFGGQLEKKTI